MNHSKVYIGVPTAEFARFAIFYDYLDFLEKPEGSIVRKFHTNAAAHNRNLIIDDAIAHGCSHILFIDDDMAFAPNSLMNLLKHDVSVVGGLYYNKAYPHPPVLFDLNLGRRHLRDGENGLIQVGACGFGFMLVNVNTIMHIEPPYVRHGEINFDKRNEDIGFCIRLRDVGIQIHCDLNTVIGHIGVATFWPTYKEKKWYTTIDTGREEMLVARQKTGEIVTPLDK